MKWINAYNTEKSFLLNYSLKVVIIYCTPGQHRAVIVTHYSMKSLRKEEIPSKDIDACLDCKCSDKILR